MKVVGIIQARMCSTRLPGKVLKPILGRPLLVLMMERVSHAQLLDQVVVATTGLNSDVPIVRVCEQNGFSYFRGSAEDVLDRYYQAARAFGADVIVRLTADCPLMDPHIIDNVVQIFLNSECDFVSNAEPLPSSWPDGMDVTVVSFQSLEQAWRNALKPSEREHVTFYFWNNPDAFSIHNRIEHDPDWSNYRLTVDYPQDLDLVSAIFEALYRNNPVFGLDDIAVFLETNPHIRQLNQHFGRGQGWQSAFERDRKAGF